jgi:hypothetical protein
MGEALGRVRATRIFAETYGFVKSKGDRDIVLSELGTRLVQYSGNARIDFLILNVRLQDKEPFAFLRRELERSKTLTPKRIAGLLRLKFGAPKSTLALNYARGYGEWLVVLRIARWNKDVLQYTAGSIRSLDILALKEADRLLDRSVYDWITETFSPLDQISDEPVRLLSDVTEAGDDNLRGELFEEFTSSIFRRMGFSPRMRDGVREAGINLTYQRPGGGDVAVFCHFPVVAGGKVHPGIAMACEAKSTEGQVGSTAVAQARNLSKKISEAFAGYLVQTLVISRSKVGYDSSGREQAPPEVVHLTADLLLKALDLQLARVKKCQTLITPLAIALTIDDLVGSKNLQPDWETLSVILQKHILREE